jgi:hypothetical protein
LGLRNTNRTTCTEPETYGPITDDDERRERSKRPLTRDLKESIRERASRDAGFREALLTEAVDALLSGDVKTGKTVLRITLEQQSASTN